MSKRVPRIYHTEYMKTKFGLVVALCLLMPPGCVSKKKYNAQSENLNRVTDNYHKTVTELESEKKKSKLLEEQLAIYKQSNSLLADQLKNLSVISQSQAESIKRSLDNMTSKDLYIRNLQNQITYRDSINLQLVMSIKSVLKDINDKDIEVKVEGSAVFINISDRLLFNVGSYDVSSEARIILEKVTRIVNAHPDIRFMVEGHTDNSPIKPNSTIQDNWDLSVLRASAVVRVLQKEFSVSPQRMIASGRGEFIPVSDNSTEAGKSLNRRTRIVLIPQLDQFFKLLE